MYKLSQPNSNKVKADCKQTHTHSSIRKRNNTQQIEYIVVEYASNELM